MLKNCARIRRLADTLRYTIAIQLYAPLHDTIQLHDSPPRTSRMCEVLCRAHVQQREKYSRGDERRGMCSSGAMDGSNARWWARQHFRIHELLGEPAVPKFCTSHQLLCLYRQRQFAFFCKKRSACGTVILRRTPFSVPYLPGS